MTERNAGEAIPFNSSTSRALRVQTPVVPSFIEDDEARTSFEDHEQHLCAPDVCTWHAGEDILRARAIKEATRRLAARRPDYMSVSTEAYE